MRLVKEVLQAQHVLGLDRDLLDVGDDAVDALAVVRDDDVEPLEQARRVRRDVARCVSRLFLMPLTVVSSSS